MYKYLYKHKPDSEKMKRGTRVVLLRTPRQLPQSRRVFCFFGLLQCSVALRATLFRLLVHFACDAF